MAKRRKPTLAQAREHALAWESSIQQLMADLGLPKTADDEHMQCWQAQTRYGALDITHFIRSEMYSDSADCMNTMGLYSRFAEPARAKAAGMACNPHTGKWNWHFFDCEMSDAINRIRQDLTNILITQAQEAA